MKNELILASRPGRVNAAKAGAARERLVRVIDEIGLGDLSERFAVVPGPIGTFSQRPSRRSRATPGLVVKGNTG